MAYITPATDITDVDVKQFVTASDARLANWLAELDAEIEALAYERGLTHDDIHTTLNPVCKSYAISFYCYIVFRDNVGSTNPDTSENEKYLRKLEIYGAECTRKRSACTKELLFEGDHDENIDSLKRIPANVLYRGD